MPEPTSTSASGGAPAAPASAAQAAPVVQVHVSSAEKNAYVMRLIAQYGSADNALTQIAGKQIHYQKRAQEAERQLHDARQHPEQFLAKDAVVVTGDQARAFNELKEKGITLDKVPKLLSDASTLAAKVSADERTTAISTAAGQKYKSKVLALLLGDKPLEFRDALVKQDDGTMKTERVPYIKVGDTIEPLDTWLEREHKDSLDVLKADPNMSADGSTTPPGGTTMPTQSRSGAGGSPPPGSKNAEIVTATLNQKYSTPSQRRTTAAKSSA